MKPYVAEFQPAGPGRETAWMRELMAHDAALSARWPRPWPIPARKPGSASKGAFAEWSDAIGMALTPASRHGLLPPGPTFRR